MTKLFGKCEITTMQTSQKKKKKCFLLNRRRFSTILKFVYVTPYARYMQVNSRTKSALLNTALTGVVSSSFVILGFIEKSSLAFTDLWHLFYNSLDYFRIIVSVVTIRK